MRLREIRHLPHVTQLDRPHQARCDPTWLATGRHGKPPRGPLRGPCVGAPRTQNPHLHTLLLRHIPGTRVLALHVQEGDLGLRRGAGAAGLVWGPCGGCGGRRVLQAQVGLLETPSDGIVEIAVLGLGTVETQQSEVAHPPSPQRLRRLFAGWGMKRVHQIPRLGEDTVSVSPFQVGAMTPMVSDPAQQQIGKKRPVAPRVPTPDLGNPPATLTPGKRGAYPGAGGGQGLPEGLKPHLLVVAHELGQAAVALSVPGDQVAPVSELGDDKVPASVAAPATRQAGLTLRAPGGPCRVGS